MAKKITLCLVLILAIACLPETGLTAPKKTSLSRKSSKSYSSSRGKQSDYYYVTTYETVTSRRRSSSSYGDDDFVPTYYRPSASARPTHDSTPSYTPSPVRAGITDTKPLMKVTPQRDGRFLLEPMGPKPKGGPSSKLDDSRNTTGNVAPGGRGYNLYEPWNFRDLVLTMAKGYTGTPYRMGGSLENGSATDCSGFVQYIYKGFKINLPRSSIEQAQVGQTVTSSLDYSKLVPGDILFFSRAGRSVGHTGIYIGEGKMIHASTYRTGVIVSDLKDGHYDHRFVVAKRVFEVAYLK